jgi:copper chaperone CopZ
MGFPSWEGQGPLDSVGSPSFIYAMAKSTPLQFDVPGMECDSCIASVTKAVHRIDPAAHVSADLASKRVVIGGKGEPHEFMRAIEDAGFDVQAAA